MCVLHEMDWQQISWYDVLRSGATMTLMAVVLAPWVLLGVAAGKIVRLMEEAQAKGMVSGM